MRISWVNECNCAWECDWLRLQMNFDAENREKLIKCENNKIVWLRCAAHVRVYCVCVWCVLSETQNG